MKKIMTVLGLSLCMGLSACTVEKPKEEVKEKEKVKETLDYTILEKESIQFDETPVAYFNKGYLVKVNGMYGFLGKDGTYIFEPQYPRLLVSSDDVLLMNDSAEVMSIREEGPRMFGGLGGAVTSSYVVDLENNGMGKQFRDGSYVEESLDTSRIVYEKVDGLSDPVGYYLNEASNYYIYNKSSDTVYGPYTRDEMATFSFLAVNKNKQDETYSVYFDLGPNYYVSGLFYEKLDNGKFKIHVLDDSKVSKKEFDSVKFLNDTSARVKYKGKLGIVDQDGELCILEDCEDISEPIDGKAYIKLNGTWSFIKLNK